MNGWKLQTVYGGRVSQFCHTQNVPTPTSGLHVGAAYSKASTSAHLETVARQNHYQ